MGIDKSNPWQLMKRKTKFSCKYFDVRQDFVRHAGKAKRPYSSIRMHYSGVAVAPIDGQGRVILVGQYRYVLDRYTWEVPGGGAATGNDHLAVAQAELKEETGCSAKHWLPIIEGAASTGTSDEVKSGFAAWHLEDGTPQPDEEELISLRRVPFSEAVSMTLNGQIANIIGSALLLGIHARLVRGTLPVGLAALLNKHQQ